MAYVESNKRISNDIFMLTAKLDKDQGSPYPGQFFMIRTWQGVPLLNRPISVYDYEPGPHRAKFLYKLIGKGTIELASIAPGSDIEIFGPFGKGFPDVDSDLILVGGGIGIAPLYYAGKMFKQQHPARKLRTYLGYSLNVFEYEPFYKISDEIVVQAGGNITDKIEIKGERNVFACGPEQMMITLNRILPPHINVYESFEARMACGFGSCLTCVGYLPINYRKKGNRIELVNPLYGKQVKICTDGPVFLREVAR